MLNCVNAMTPAMHLTTQIGGGLWKKRYQESVLDSPKLGAMMSKDQKKVSKGVP